MHTMKLSKKVAQELWKNGTVEGFLKHIIRSELDPNIHHNNQQIDKARTHLNVEVIPNKGNSYLKDFKALMELPKIVKSNSVQLASTIITLPKELDNTLSYERKVEWFKEASKLIYDFWEVEDQYKITSMVHFDETTPHCHVVWAPITYKKEKQKYVFNAKYQLNRIKFNQFHDVIQEQLRAKFPDLSFSLVADDKEKRAKESLKQEDFKDQKMDLVNKAIKHLETSFDLFSNKKMFESLDKWKEKFGKNLEPLIDSIQKSLWNSFNVVKEYYDKLENNKKLLDEANKQIKEEINSFQQQSNNLEKRRNFLRREVRELEEKKDLYLNEDLEELKKETFQKVNYFRELFNDEWIKEQGKLLSERDKKEMLKIREQKRQEFRNNTNEDVRDFIDSLFNKDKVKNNGGGRSF